MPEDFVEVEDSDSNEEVITIHETTKHPADIKTSAKQEDRENIITPPVS